MMVGVIIDSKVPAARGYGTVPRRVDLNPQPQKQTWGLKFDALGGSRYINTVLLYIAMRNPRAQDGNSSK